MSKRAGRGRAVAVIMVVAGMASVQAVEMMPVPPPAANPPPAPVMANDVPVQRPAPPPPPPLPPSVATPARPAPTNAPATASLPAQPLRPGELVFNFQDADIQAVVKTVSQLTGRNFLLDPRVKGKITIISAKPISKDAAYEIFVSALKAQGFSAVEGPGQIVKILPEAEAKQYATVSGRAHASDRWVTQVVVVQHASASQLIPLLRPMMSPNALLSVYAPGNVLVITDTSTAVRNVLRVIDRIDQPSSTEVTVIPLQYASAMDITQVVARFADTGQVPGQPQVPGQVGGDHRLTIVPDLRTNSLLVRADNPARVLELRSLIAKLDVPAKPGGQTHVVYLRNAEAKKLAEVLRGLLQGEARAASATAAAPGGVAATGAAAARAIEASQVQADEATNALVISAPDASYNNLRAVIEKLDTRRAQVYVEALIAEVTSSRTTELGINWAGVGGLGDGAIGALSQFPGPNNPGAGVVVDPLTALGGSSGLTLGIIGREVTLPDGTKARGLGALARALQTDTSANILSAPNLLTLDNAEAKIVVGKNVPFVTGSFTPATGGGATTQNPFQTIERKDVALTLKIKPQISEGGGVKLQIFQEIQDLLPSVENASDLITSKRSVETTIVVDDGNIVVLGGLMEDKDNDTVQGVPGLSRIPFLGEMFKYRSKSKDKTNLMVFLRPVIVRNERDTLAVTTDRYRHIQAQQQDLTKEQRKILERFEPSQTPAARAPAPESGRLGPPQVPDTDYEGE